MRGPWVARGLRTVGIPLAFPFSLFFFSYFFFPLLPRLPVCVVSPPQRWCGAAVNAALLL